MNFSDVSAKSIPLIAPSNEFSPSLKTAVISGFSLITFQNSFFNSNCSLNEAGTILIFFFAFTVINSIFPPHKKGHISAPLYLNLLHVQLLRILSDKLLNLARFHLASFLVYQDNAEMLHLSKQMYRMIFHHNHYQLFC